MPSPIFWDYNATTPLDPEVARFLAQTYAAEGARPGNPSSVHGPGREARRRLQAARALVAQGLGCLPKEVVFTGSGSESLALALKGAFLARPDPARRRIVASSIEHPSLLFALEQLEALGAIVHRVPPERSGAVRAQAFEEALSEDTFLGSLMWANNETGVLQPVADVARACRRRGILFHTDAVQAVGKVPVSFTDVDADLLSLSGHKFGAPAGTGALAVRGPVALHPLVAGHQEGGRRGGTPEVALFEALALGFTRAQARATDSAAQSGVGRLRDDFERRLRGLLPDVDINGKAPRVPNTSNVHFPDVDGEALLIALDLEGIAVSAGAACASGTLQPSHVLTSMGLSGAEAKRSLRFSLSASATEEEVQRVTSALHTHVLRLRGQNASHRA